MSLLGTSGRPSTIVLVLGSIKDSFISATGRNKRLKKASVYAVQ